MKNTIKVLFAVLSLGFALTSCTSDSIQRTAGDLSFTQMVASNPDFSEFYKALELTGLLGVATDNSHTVFVPNNQAMSLQLSGKTAAEVFAINPTGLTEAMKYYIANGLVTGDQFSDNYVINTMAAGKTLKIKIEDDGTGKMITKLYDMTDNGNRFNAMDVKCTDGYIFTIDSYLMTP